MPPTRPKETPAERRERKAAIDDPAVVLEAAARFLETRPRSVTEVRRRLGQAGYRTELIDGAIERLTELGMLDDEQFARQWVESRDRAHPRGEHALIVELRQKGIEATTIATVLKDRRELAVRWEDRPPAEELPADDGASHPDLAAARRLIERNRRALDRVADPRQRRQKAYALLARNGFDPETCREIAIEAATPPAEDAANADEEPAVVEE
ncbi:MAG TPA: regulatory protein RecX [Candidatus Limnocylindrales bacterium]